MRLHVLKAPPLRGALKNWAARGARGTCNGRGGGRHNDLVRGGAHIAAVTEDILLVLKIAMPQAAFAVVFTGVAAPLGERLTSLSGCRLELPGPQLLQRFRRRGLVQQTGLKADTRPLLF